MGLNDRDIELRHFAAILVESFHPASSLDLGCGQGFLVRHLRELSVDACGVDVSRSALAQVPPQVRPYLFATDLENEKLPFASQSMDLVTALEVLEHLKNPKHVMSEIKRVVRPEGMVFMTSVLPMMNSKLFRFLLGHGWRVLDATHVNVHGRSFWRNIFEKHGFGYQGSLSRCYGISLSGQSHLTLVLIKLPFGARVRAFLSGAQIFQLLPDCTEDRTVNPSGVSQEMSHS